MNISRIIGSNIKNLMEVENISLRKLAESLEISHPTLKRYVDGDQPIDSEKLMKIARFFGRSFDYFFSESHSEFNFMFRADNPESKLEKSDFDEYRQALLDYVNVVGDFKVNYIPQSYNIKIEGKKIKKDELKIIEEIANDHRRMLNIEAIIPGNYFELIEGAGINVIVRRFSNSSFFGASSFSQSYGSFIIINDMDSISEERKIFSLIHEYAHLILDREHYAEYDKSYLYSSLNSNEEIANQFAAYFLMPRKMVDDYFHVKSEISLIDMKKHFKVSLQALVRILHEYGYMDTEQYNKFWAIVYQNGKQKIEPEPLEYILLQDKNPKLFNSIRELFIKDEISINRIAEILGLANLEARTLVKKWRENDERYLYVP